MEISSKNRTVIGYLVLCFMLMSTNLMTNSQEMATEYIEFDGTFRRINVPILMYHYISELPEDADVYREDLTVTPSVFREHLAYLRENQYNSISLYDLHLALIQGEELPQNPIIITFDDGYIDHYINAFPSLLEFGFHGTFFVITDRLDNNDPAYLSWSQAREMQNSGMNIESHTKSHPDLRQRDFDFLVFQIMGSLESIMVNLNTPTHMFSYPAGRYDEDTLRVLNSTPIWLATTTRHGRTHTSDRGLELRRLRISGDMGVLGLSNLLE